LPKREPKILAGIELGGTRTVAVLGRGTEIFERVRFPTTSPKETLHLLGERLARWDGIYPIAALGIAGFGPLVIDPAHPRFGHLLDTPKKGWSGADLLGPLAHVLDCPAAIHTDVTAAALAEGRWGAARNCSDHVYITVGTGIGMGIVVAGRPVRGRLHPEAGHMRVTRAEGDDFPGCCPFHGDCLEGLASGIAIAQRAGKPGAKVADDDLLWDAVADALAQACANLRLTLACERIVLGGGVIRGRPMLVERIAERTNALLGGYLPDVANMVAAAELGEDAGPRGALLLAAEALTVHP
jgi:fructokinase